MPDEAESPWEWFVSRGTEIVAPFRTEGEAWTYVAYHDDLKSSAPDPPKEVRVTRRLDLLPSGCAKLGYCPSCRGGGTVERLAPTRMSFCLTCHGTGRLGSP